MIIKKGEREYSVTELSHEWKAERVLGGVAVEYKRSNGDITRKHIRSFLRAFQRKRRRLSRRNVPPRVFRKRRLSKRR